MRSSGHFFLAGIFIAGILLPVSGQAPRNRISTFEMGKVGWLPEYSYHYRLCFEGIRMALEGRKRFGFVTTAFSSRR